MRAVVADPRGAAGDLKLADVPMPPLRAGEVLIRSRATALNRADILQRRGKYPPPEGASDILGLEVSGEVVRVGEGVTAWCDGDRVCALLAGGGYATHVAVPAAHVLPVPVGLGFEEAAAIPEVFLTAYQALYQIAGVRAGDHVLVHAGASGVGTAAIQLARRAGAQVYVTASAAKHEACRSLGATTAFDYRTEDWAEGVLDATDGHGADVIVDFIGAPYLDRNVHAAATDGRLVLLALMGGARVDAFHLGSLFRKRLSITASTLRNRSDAYKAELVAAFRAEAWQGFEDGTLRPVIDRIYPWADVADAHACMEANQNVGKIVLRIDE